MLKPFPGPAVLGKVGDAVGWLLAITGISFAVSLAALSVVISLPWSRTAALMVVNARDIDRVNIGQWDGRWLVDGSEPGPEFASRVRVLSDRSWYLDLVFLYYWTVATNLLASIALVVLGIVCGNGWLLSPSSVWVALLTGCVGGVVLYALLQLESSLTATYSFARAIQVTWLSDLTDRNEEVTRRRPAGAAERE